MSVVSHLTSFHATLTRANQTHGTRLQQLPPILNLLPTYLTRNRGINEFIRQQYTPDTKELQAKINNLFRMPPPDDPTNEDSLAAWYMHLITRVTFWLDIAKATKAKDLQQIRDALQSYADTLGVGEHMSLQQPQPKRQKVGPLCASCATNYFAMQLQKHPYLH